MTDGISLQEIKENAEKSMESLTAQLEGESLEDLPMCELLGLERQLRSIRGLLKVKIVKKVNYSNSFSNKSVSSRKLKTIQNMIMAFERT